MIEIIGSPTAERLLDGRLTIDRVQRSLTSVISREQVFPAWQ